MTAVTGPRSAHVEMVTPAEAKAEIERLLEQVGMTRAELERRGKAWELNADQRGALADIQGLEFLLGRTSSQ